MESKVVDLLVTAVTLFEEQFKYRPTHASCAPGRVNLIGEHTDYNDGFVLPMALPLVTLMVGASTKTSVCRILTNASVGDEPMFVEFNSPTAGVNLEPGKPSWANYVKGVIACYPDKDVIQSFDAVILSTVPLGGGLSSSASLEMATFTLLESLYGQSFSSELKAKCCQRAEHTFANMPCGIMDQTISSMGQERHALLIDCRSLQCRLVPFADPCVVILITNSNVRHKLSESEYPVRRAQCQQAATTLGVDKLRDASISQLQDAVDKLDATVYRRARHVITENQRCQDAATALEQNDYEQFGKLMFDSHQSLRDDYDVSCPEIDELISITREVSGVFGSRITGGGFGGCTVTLVKSDVVQQLIQHIKESYSGNAEFYICQASSGARQLTIPAAYPNGN